MTNILAQTSCICPKVKRETTHILTLSNKATIEICGSICVDYWTSDIKERVYVGYLFDNKTNELVFKWNEYATIEQLRDTIRITEYFSLPVEKDFNLTWHPFIITYVYNKNDTIEIEKKYFTDKTKYTSKEIKNVIRRYKTRSTVKNIYSLDASENLRLCYQLFWCYVSGSNFALEYLKEAKEKLQLSIHKDEYFKLLRIYDEFEVHKQKGWY